jgi:hypothetical protein
MPHLILDDCSHCACQTDLGHISVEEALEGLNRGEIVCENCRDHQSDGEEDGHVKCVALFDSDENVLWDGRCAP